MKYILRFIVEAGGWAVSSTLTALILFGLAQWEHAEHPISAFVFLTISVPLFWTGAVLVVLRQRKELEAAKAEIDRLKQQPEGPEMWLSFEGMTIGHRVLRITNVAGGTARDVQLQEMTDGELVAEKSEVIPFLGIGQSWNLRLQVRIQVRMADEGWQGVPFSIDSFISKPRNPITATIVHLDANGAQYSTVFQITASDPLTVEIRQIKRNRH